MPKKAKIFNVSISTSIQLQTRHLLDKIKDVTHISPARLLRNFCTTSIPGITFTQEFWRRSGAGRILDSEYSKGQIIAIISDNLGIDFSDPKHRPCNYTEIIQIVQAFYDAEQRRSKRNDN